MISALDFCPNTNGDGAGCMCMLRRIKEHCHYFDSASEGESDEEDHSGSDDEDYSDEDYSNDNDEDYSDED